MDIRKTIVAYIEDVSREKGFDQSCNLFEAGLLTSLDVLSLVAFLEEAFALEISGDDVDMDHFGTIDGLVSLVAQKQTVAA
ncbi:hypothetical protein CQ12_30450 [Bradyrhizobium jicamae]|uniref:Carrier domain-containing protein n=1 Tax=Bradyrhizobium jicamae TaxID=280332 RepID=A0A0R3KD07_9BRAD|nr:phosphopantetheine-binding protein [Bradyrhizobium jicamae]KRQ92938.1 hypothetical protein CQ12_30450 [Bradyrhizobium jicamae]